MKLSILIVNYNGKRYLGNCLGSIRRNVTVDHEVIVVDNASTDDSARYLRGSFTDVRLIVSERNIGFAAGNNIASKYAQGEYILLLNNDTVLLNDVGPAIEILDRNHQIGNVGAMMLNGGKQYDYSAGYFPSPMRLLKLSSTFKKNGYFKDGNFPRQYASRGYGVDWVSGAFLLTRRLLWNSLNGLDEGFFMYVEDADYCRRTREAGFLTVYCPQVRYVHYCGYDSSRFPFAVRGLLRYHKKHSHLLQRLLASGILFSGLIARIFYYELLSVTTRKAAYEVKANACVAALKAF